MLLRGIRLPAPQAALLNASMGHALDFDDTLDTGGSIHPGVSVLGAVLAVADSLEGVSGRDVLLAVALGLDISCRIALCEHARPRLASHRGDRGIRRHRGGRQADRPDAGTDAGRLRHRLQSRRRQPPVHSRRGADQADAGRPGGKRRRFLRRFGADRVHRRAQHLQRPFRLLRAVPAERVRRLGAPARPGHGFSRRGAELQALPLRPAAARGDRCRTGGASARSKSSGPTTSHR